MTVMAGSVQIQRCNTSNTEMAVRASGGIDSVVAAVEVTALP